MYVNLKVYRLMVGSNLSIKDEAPTTYCLIRSSQHCVFNMQGTNFPILFSHLGIINAVNIASIDFK